MNLEGFGKMLLAFAALLAVVGGALYLLGRGLNVQQLPGDIRIERDGFSCLIPIATSILVSIILTVALNLFFRFRR